MANIKNLLEQLMSLEKQNSKPSSNVLCAEAKLKDKDLTQFTETLPLGWQFDDFNSFIALLAENEIVACTIWLNHPAYCWYQYNAESSEGEWVFNIPDVGNRTPTIPLSLQ